MNKKSLLLLFVLVFIVAVSYSQSITVTNPHSGDTWYKGQTYTIRWTKSGTMDTNVKIRLMQNGTKILGITDSTANDGTFNWPIPSNLASGTYYIRVKTVDNKVYDDGEPFTITNAPAQTASITVTNPQFGHTWYKGQTYTITWTKSGTMNSNVKIRLMQNGTKVISITDSTPNNGTFNWPIPANLASGTYYIRVKTIDNKVYDDSYDFKITNAPQQTARIIVTSPFTENIWYKGKTYTIRWMRRGVMNSNVKIRLMQNGTKILAITDSTPNDGTFGSFRWTIPASVTNGSYKIRVKTIDNAVYDDSDVFRIESNNFTFDRDMNKALSDEGLISGVRKIKLLPDLMVYGERLYYVDLEQHVANFHAAVKNIGKSDAKNVLMKLMAYPKDSAGRILMSQVATYTKTFRSIPVGMTAAFDQTYKLKTMGLTYYFVFEVNPDHSIEESNYNNNLSKKTIIRENLPDLITWVVMPQHSVWIKSDVVAGVQNVGKKRSAPTRLKYYIEGKGTKYYDVPALDPGQYVYIDRNEWFHSAKDVWAELWVDPDNLVREDHENNNHYKIKLDIKWQDLL